MFLLQNLPPPTEEVKVVLCILLPIVTFACTFLYNHLQIDALSEPSITNKDKVDTHLLTGLRFGMSGPFISS